MESYGEQSNQSDDKGQSDAIAATIAELTKNNSHLGQKSSKFLLLRSLRPVKVLQRLNVEHLQYAVYTHLILLRKISKDSDDMLPNRRIPSAVAEMVKVKGKVPKRCWG